MSAFIIINYFYVGIQGYINISMKVVDIILEYVMLLQGFPDLSVIRDDDPHLFLDV